MDDDLPAPSRRALLGGAAGVLATLGSSGLLTACGSASTHRRRGPSPAPAHRLHYGDLPDQYVDVRRPTRPTAAPVVVLLHGGYWLPPYRADLMVPLAVTLTRLGCTTWNVEYRRTGEGGGVPTTLQDVAAGLDLLPQHESTRDVVLLGHSAGGQLAVWAASRTATTPGGAPTWRPRLAVSLGGVLDLRLAAASPESEAPVTQFLGGTPARVPTAYAEADPSELVPPRSPVAVVQASDDMIVRAAQGTSYLARARSAGGQVEYVTVPGGHGDLIDPSAAAFAAVRRLVIQDAPTGGRMHGSPAR